MKIIDINIIIMYDEHRLKQRGNFMSFKRTASLAAVFATTAVLAASGTASAASGGISAPAQNNGGTTAVAKHHKKKHPAQTGGFAAGKPGGISASS